MSEKAIPSPVGATNEYYFELDRCRELSRAIYEYFSAGLCPKQEWCEELARRYPLVLIAEKTWKQ